MSGIWRAAPRYESLVAAHVRALRCGPSLSEISVRVEVVTPFFGGAASLRALDDIDIVRPASIRGQLRFWWRALNGHLYDSPKELYIRESHLWGRAAEVEGGRSAIELRVAVEQAGKSDSSDIRLYDSRDGKATPGAYALWPAREEKRKGLPTAPRRAPGTRFRLTLLAPSSDIKEVENVVRAWLLFGGYGSRARRGLGSFRVVDAPEVWLPTAAKREEFERLFGRDIFAALPRSAHNVPWLSSAALHVAPAQGNAETAWTTALEWLKEFRQGTSGGPDGRAREPGAGGRPSISNWPEADKIRHLKGKINAHPPRHNAAPAWPRTGFGLPIIGQFQNKGRDGSWLDEPEPFELRWREPSPGKPEQMIEHDRLASPLIVKAMPLAEGKFVPIALWLNRAYPLEGKVLLRGLSDSAAPFDRLVAAGDRPRFSSLAEKQSLREAFLDWLHNRYSTAKVAP
ncbi:MAG: type III-B CRISPR module RAMP protein Cmr1 [Candidatus Hydrogenedentes bacterium]|nr:type III-B CRISPR module RAMP protein Cmr1 [Candidatus Hydrogenedentota bacterium]